MIYTLPKNIENMVPYQPISGNYRVRLDANESFVPLPPALLAQFQESLLSTAFNRYPDPYAKKLCEKFAAYYGINSDCVTAFDGSDELLGLMSGTLYQDGQKLAVFSDDFSMYQIYAESYGAECLVIPKEDDLTISVDKALAFIQEQQISAILFSNPCNPTSLGLAKSEVIRLLKGTDALVILDEAYMDFWSQSLLSQVEEFDNLIILKTCSKAMGLAGIRLGFAVTNAYYTKVLRAVKSPYNVNTVSQTFGEIVLNDPDFLHESIDLIVSSRIALQVKLQEMQQIFSFITKLYDSCSNFVYMETTCTQQLFEGLLKHSVAVRKMGNFLRISAGNSEENEQLLSALRMILIEIQDQQ